MTSARPLEWTASVGDAVAELSWSPDGKWLAVGGVAGGVLLLDSCTGELIRSWEAHRSGLFRCAFSPLSNQLATSGQDGHARIWEVDTGTCGITLPTQARWVEQMAWSSDGQWLAVGAGRQLLLWEPATGRVREVPAGKSTIAAVAWHPLLPELASARFGGVDVWSAQSGQLKTALPWKTSLISVGMSADGRWVVAGTQELSVQVWGIPFQPGDELAMSGYSAKVRHLAWHYSSRYLATAGGEEIMVWDCGGNGPAGTSPRVLTGHTGKVTSLAYQRSGHLLASGGEDGRIHFWNAGKSSEALRRHSLGAAVTALAWDARDQRLAIGTHEGEVGLAKPPI